MRKNILVAGITLLALALLFGVSYPAGLLFSVPISVLNIILGLITRTPSGFEIQPESNNIRLVIDRGVVRASIYQLVFLNSKLIFKRLSSVMVTVILAFILAVVGLAVWTAYYTVPSDSVAVVQRFGKYLKDVPAGLHFKLPLGIDVATIVPVKRQLKQEFGFATPGASDPFQTSRDGKRETQMVTGDLNAVLVEWVVQYRILDPVKFLFDVREPRGTLRDVSESVMREVVGDRTVDEVITIGRQEIETEALTKMQALSTKYAMGISIDQVQLKNINPPEPVQVSFNEVNQAQQEKEKLINEARREYNKVIPLADGEKRAGLGNLHRAISGVSA